VNTVVNSLSAGFYEGISNIRAVKDHALCDGRWPANSIAAGCWPLFCVPQVCDSIFQVTLPSRWARSATQ